MRRRPPRRTQGQLNMRIVKELHQQGQMVRSGEQKPPLDLTAIEAERGAELARHAQHLAVLQEAEHLELPD